MKHPAVLLRRRALFGIAAALITLAAATAFSMRWKGAEEGDGGLPGPEAAMEDDFGNSFARLSSTGVDAAKNGGFTLTLETEPGSPTSSSVTTFYTTWPCWSKAVLVMRCASGSIAPIRG